jgi:predicted ATPase
MLSRIAIKGYKSLNDVTVNLNRLNVLFGPNAAGKSNFLDALQLLSRIANVRTLKDAFEPPYRGKPLESFAFGPEGIESVLKSESAWFSIEADVELSPSIIRSVDAQIREMRRSIEIAGEPNGHKNGVSFVKERNLRYRIEVEILPKSGILRVRNEYLSALNQDGTPTSRRKPFLEKMGKKLHLRMEGQSHPKYYEELLDHSILSLPLYPPHYPHLVAMSRELASWKFFYLEPRERMRAASPVKEARHIGLMGEDLASFLNTLKVLDPSQFRSVEKSLHMLIPSITGIDLNVNSVGEVELRLLEGTTPVPARVLSEGTLRLLGLLALGGAKDRPALIGFEEPENGIHPRRIRLVADLLRSLSRESQLIVTTHSALLTDLVMPQNLLVCRKRNKNTEIFAFDSPEGPLWKSNNIDDALDDEEGEQMPISQRILRGDFDA